MTLKIFGTDDMNHPGVNAFNTVGNLAISGPIQVLNYSYFETDFPGTFKTAYEIRDEMSKLGWEKVVAFQTRNPMHLAHEELCRMAYKAENADGILIHMLLGKLKPGDIPADVRDACIRKMVDVYFEPNTVLVTGYGFDMLYAGPREALLHAVFRQNCGCTHLIVGRDHAGVGDYYGPFDAQTIFDELPKDALEIDIFAADHTAWSKKLNKVVMMRDVPDHTKDDFVLLSGTKVREMLGAGQGRQIAVEHVFQPGHLAGRLHGPAQHVGLRGHGGLERPHRLGVLHLGALHLVPMPAVLLRGQLLDGGQLSPVNLEGLGQRAGERRA